ncbi:MAG: hypothetical protein H6700_08860 [Myxococcales bacterium]|nr:hypothetical protein [Myxococcales bacterium]MCB9521113.1 hypothetical protein [Myxococcales bacterium]MCB9531861.1 hypothetical protein [Myxococcales bacterium]
MASIDDILALIDSGADADHLLTAAIEADSPDLYASGVDDHGSWEAALAAALVYVRRTTTADDTRVSSAAPERPDDPRPPRTVGPGSHSGLHVVSDDGALTNLDLPALACTAAPQWQAFPPGPRGIGRPSQIVFGGDDPGLVILTSRGNGLGVDSRLLAAWGPDGAPRPLHARFGDVEHDEVAATATARRPLRDADRLFTVSVFGQLKATDTPEYKRLSADAITAVLLRDGDALFAAFPGSRRSRVLIATSAAKAIVFDTSEVRSQGRKATGVRGIALDTDARVVGAFAVDSVEWFALATAAGYVKRMRVEEFRPQGRGGGGLQSCRIAGGDHVASAAPIALDGDVVMLTNRGRFARFPAYDLPFGGRASRGEQLLELEAGEEIVQLIGVPAGTL